MITKKQLFDSIAHETNVIKHLYGKTTKELLGFKPGANMRSTLELLQYLTMCAIGSARSLVHNNWDIARTLREDVKSLKAEQIPQKLDEQLQAFAALLNEIDEQELITKEVVYPWGGKDQLGNALINTSLKFITAYKMQLFIYLKTGGLSQLATSNCWRGCDPTQP